MKGCEQVEFEAKKKRAQDRWVGRYVTTVCMSMSPFRPMTVLYLFFLLLIKSSVSTRLQAGADADSLVEVEELFVGQECQLPLSCERVGS